MDEDDRLSISWEGAVQLCTQPWCTGGVRWTDLEIDEEALRRAAARQQELLEQPQDVPPLAAPSGKLGSAHSEADLVGKKGEKMVTMPNAASPLHILRIELPDKRRNPVLIIKAPT